jgi:hypothetical protein
LKRGFDKAWSAGIRKFRRFGGSIRSIVMLDNFVVEP